MMPNEAYYIMLRDSSVVLSRKEYGHWREIQEEYGEAYATSFAPITAEDLMAFFREDFGDEGNWPLSAAEIEGFYSGDALVYRSKPMDLPGCT